MEGTGFCLSFLTFFAGIVLSDVTIFRQFFFDLTEIIFGSGNIQCIGYGFQMFNLGFCVCNLFCKSFLFSVYRNGQNISWSFPRESW